MIDGRNVHDLLVLRDHFAVDLHVSFFDGLLIFGLFEAHSAFSNLGEAQLKINK